ncbi:MAG: hypothetical protein ACOYL8_01750 [Patescibacteria group bacterium]
MEQKNVKFDAIFCQSFGRGKNGPGLSNECLAKSITEIQEKCAYNKPLIIQKDCADAFPTEIKIDKIISEHQTPGKYLDSYEVSRQCLEYCLKNNIKTLLVFAHPAHIWRVQQTLENFGLKTIGVTCDVPYDPQSDQLWTRSKWLFIPWELFARLSYIITRKI